MWCFLVKIRTFFEECPDCKFLTLRRALAFRVDGIWASVSWRATDKYLLTFYQ